LITAIDPARVLLDASGAVLADSSRRRRSCQADRQESGQIVGFPIETRDEAMRRRAQIAARGPRIVLMSLGQDGAIVYEREQDAAWIVEAPRVVVRNPVGAGDCLLGAFAVGCCARAARRVRAIRGGVGHGQGDASGHRPSSIRADVDALRPQVTITRVARTTLTREVGGPPHVVLTHVALARVPRARVARAEVPLVHVGLSNVADAHLHSRSRALVLLCAAALALALGGGVVTIDAQRPAAPAAAAGAVRVWEDTLVLRHTRKVRPM